MRAFPAVLVLLLAMAPGAPLTSMHSRTRAHVQT
jgi:hypothetical protein